MAAVRHEELRCVLVFSVVRHGQCASLVVFEVWVYFVCKRNTVNRLSAFARTAGVTTLDNESLDVAMEFSAVVIACSAQAQEIPARFGRLNTVQLKLQVAYVLYF